MLAKEGITSFWKGTIPSLFLVVQASLQITIYDHIKVYLLSPHHRSESIGATSHLSTWQYLYSSASSKIISMLILYPTQVVRSRLQYSQDSSLSIVSIVKSCTIKRRIKGVLQRNRCKYSKSSTCNVCYFCCL